MRYSTKFWLILFVALLVKLIIWLATPPFTEAKEGILISLSIAYVIFIVADFQFRNDFDDEYPTRYFNIIWLLYTGIVLFNRWLDKQE